MTLTVRRLHEIDTERIVRIAGVDDRNCRVVYRDEEAHYVGGMVAMSADALVDLLDAEREQTTDDALRACESVD